MQLAELIEAAGLDSVLIRDVATCTIQKTRLLSGDRHLIRIDRERIGVSPEASERLIAEAEARIEGCDCVIVSDYAKGAVTPGAMARILVAAGRRGIPVLVDPKHADFSLYEGAAVLTPNRAELARATGETCDGPDSQLQAARAASALTGAAILLTMGEQGMALYQEGEEIWREATRACSVRDVSGAGDTVIAVFALALAAGVDMIDAARLANAAAGVVVGKSGLSSLTSAELTRAVTSVSAAEPPSGKQVDRDGGVAIREHWRAQGLTVGLTNGCFDLLHPGHLQLLDTAKAACDRLIVALNSDASVRRLKGRGRPIQSETARATIVAALRPVDLVMLFAEDTPLELIQAVRPDVLVKGADYAADEVVGAEAVASYGGEVLLASLAEGHSTSTLIRRAARDPG